MSRLSLPYLLVTVIPCSANIITSKTLSPTVRLSSSSHQPAPSPSQTQSSRTANAPCFDNPGLFPLYFETGEVLVEDCAWVSESKTERCAFDGIIDQCPVSCDHCVRNDTLAPTMSSSPTAVPVPTTAHPSTHFSDSPSLSPTKTPNPTAQPTTAAQLAAPSWCRDSSEIFSVSDETGSFTCAWIAESKDDRCSSDEIRTRCPVACDFCLCTNFPIAPRNRPHPLSIQTAFDSDMVGVGRQEARWALRKGAG